MKKDLINKIILIMSGVFVLLSTVILIVLSNLPHGKQYVYKGKTFKRNEQTLQNEVIDEEIIIDFIDDTELKMTSIIDGEKNVSFKLYIIDNNYIKIANVDNDTTLTLYIDSYQIKYPFLEEKEVPDMPIFVCKTNKILKIITITVLVINSLLLIAEIIYHLYDYISWKKFLKNNQNNSNSINNLVQ